MMRDKCKKCGMKMNSYNDKGKSIADCLCKNCWDVWRIFHKKYGHEIEKKYSHGKNGHHVSWSVFIGELPNLWMSDREKVEFT